MRPLRRSFARTRLLEPDLDVNIHGEQYNANINNAKVISFMYTQSGHCKMVCGYIW